MPIPDTMKAYSYTKHGDPQEVLHRSEAASVPKPSPTQVLLKVHAASLNPVGYKSIKYFPGFMVKKPCIPEFDRSGVVVSVGEKVEKWKPGDEVYGITPAHTVIKTGQGTLTEYTIVEQDNLCRKPDFLRWEEACSFPLTALTAYKAARNDSRIPLQQAGSIFINGGSGGLGLHAVQLARHLVGDTAKVVTTCSAGNTELVKQNGADDVINYTSVSVPQYLKETIGSFEIHKACAAFLNPRGVYIMLGVLIPSSFMGFVRIGSQMPGVMYLPGVLGGVPRKFRITLMHPSKENVQVMEELVEQKVFRPVIDSVWPFDDDGIKDAYKKIMSNRGRGKVVVKMQ